MSMDFAEAQRIVRTGLVASARPSLSGAKRPNSATLSHLRSQLTSECSKRPQTAYLPSTSKRPKSELVSPPLHTPPHLQLYEEGGTSSAILEYDVVLKEATRRLIPHHQSSNNVVGLGIDHNCQVALTPSSRWLIHGDLAKYTVGFSRLKRSFYRIASDQPIDANFASTLVFSGLVPLGIPYASTIVTAALSFLTATLPNAANTSSPTPLISAPPFSSLAAWRSLPNDVRLLIRLFDDPVSLDHYHYALTHLSHLLPKRHASSRGSSSFLHSSKSQIAYPEVPNQPFLNSTTNPPTSTTTSSTLSSSSLVADDQASHLALAASIHRLVQQASTAASRNKGKVTWDDVQDAFLQRIQDTSHSGPTDANKETWVIHASKLDESISSLPATSLTDTKHNQVHADPQSAHSSTNTSAPAPLQHVSQSGPRPVTVPFTKYVASVQQILVLSSGSSILPRSTSSLASSTASMYSLPHPTSSRSEPTLCLLRCDGPGSIQIWNADRMQFICCLNPDVPDELATNLGSRIIKSDATLDSHSDASLPPLPLNTTLSSLPTSTPSTLLLSSHWTQSVTPQMPRQKALSLRTRPRSLVPSTHTSVSRTSTTTPSTSNPSLGLSAGSITSISSINQTSSTSSVTRPNAKSRPQQHVVILMRGPTSLTSTIQDTSQGKNHSNNEEIRPQTRIHNVNRLATRRVLPPSYAGIVVWPYRGVYRIITATTNGLISCYAPRRRSISTIRKEITQSDVPKDLVSSPATSIGSGSEPNGFVMIDHWGIDYQPQILNVTTLPSSQDALLIGDSTGTLRIYDLSPPPLATSSHFLSRSTNPISDSTLNGETGSSPDASTHSHCSSSMSYESRHRGPTVSFKLLNTIRHHSAKITRVLTFHPSASRILDTRLSSLSSPSHSSSSSSSPSSPLSPQVGDKHVRELEAKVQNRHDHIDALLTNSGLETRDAFRLHPGHTLPVHDNMATTSGTSRSVKSKAMDTHPQDLYILTASLDCTLALTDATTGLLIRRFGVQKDLLDCHSTTSVHAALDAWEKNHHYHLSTTRHHGTQQSRDGSKQGRSRQSVLERVDRHRWKKTKRDIQREKIASEIALDRANRSRNLTYKTNVTIRRYNGGIGGGDDDDDDNDEDDYIVSDRRVDASNHGQRTKHMKIGHRRGVASTSQYGSAKTDSDDRSDQHPSDGISDGSTASDNDCASVSEDDDDDDDDDDSGHVPDNNTDDVDGDSDESNVVKAKRRHPSNYRHGLGHESGVIALAYSHHHKIIASADLDKMVHLWDVNVKRPIASLPQQVPINDMVVNEEAHQLILLCAHDIVKVIDLRTQTQLQTIRAASSSSSSLSLTSSDSFTNSPLATGDNGIRRGGGLVGTSTGTLGLTALALDPLSQRLFVGSKGRLACWPILQSGQANDSLLPFPT